MAYGVVVFVCQPNRFLLDRYGPMRIRAAEVVGMLMLLETAVGPVWVWLVLNDIPSATAVQGGSLVVGTLLLHSLYQWRSGQKGRLKGLQTCL